MGLTGKSAQKRAANAQAQAAQTAAAIESQRAAREAKREDEAFESFKKGAYQADDLIRQLGNKLFNPAVYDPQDRPMSSILGPSVSFNSALARLGQIQLRPGESTAYGDIPSLASVGLPEVIRPTDQFLGDLQAQAEAPFGALLRDAAFASASANPFGGGLSRASQTGLRVAQAQAGGAARRAGLMDIENKVFQQQVANQERQYSAAIQDVANQLSERETVRGLASQDLDFMRRQRIDRTSQLENQRISLISMLLGLPAPTPANSSALLNAGAQSVAPKQNYLPLALTAAGGAGLFGGRVQGQLLGQPSGTSGGSLLSSVVGGSVPGAAGGVFGNLLGGLLGGLF